MFFTVLFVDFSDEKRKHRLGKKKLRTDDAVAEVLQATISVMVGKDGNVVYNIGQMRERSFPTISGSSAANSGALNQKASFDNSITDSSEKSNSQNSPMESGEYDGTVKNPIPFNVLSMEAREGYERMRIFRESSFRKMGFGDYGAKALADVEEGIPPSGIDLATKNFRTAYEAGLTGVDASQVEFTTDVQRKGFEAGQKDRIMSMEKKVDNVKNVVSHGKKAGFDSKGKPTDVTDTQMKIVDDLYKGMGVKGSLADRLKGNAELRTNIGISPIARDFRREIVDVDKVRKVSIVYHAAHEVAMHRLMELAPKEGQAFIDALYRYMNVDSAKSLAEAKRKAYAEQGVEISLEDAMEEVAANQILALYNWDEAKFAEAVNRVVKEGNKQAKIGASKFRQILNDIIERLRKLFNTLTGKQKAEVKADIDELTQLRNLFESAMVAGVKKNAEIARDTKNLEIKTNEEYNGNNKYSAKTKYNEYNTIGMQWAYASDTQVGDLNVLYNKFTGKYVLVEATKEDVGFIELNSGNFAQMRKERNFYATEKNRLDGSKETVDKVLRDFGLRRNNNHGDNVDVGIRETRKRNAKLPEGKPNSNKATDTQTAEHNTRFSLKQPVEETKDLVAMHNMSESQLLDVLTRGQFMMPSVAVTNKGLQSFGDISVLFSKDTIDPQNNSNNKLYGSDAWTPTQTELKKNPKFDDKAVANALRSIRKSLGDSQIFKDNSARFKQQIAKADGSVYNAYAHNVGMQAAYALENGMISAIPKDASGNVNTKKLQSQLDAVLDKDSEWRKYKHWLSDISNKIITSYDKASNEEILRDMKSQPDYAKKFRLSLEGELTAPVVEYSSIEDFRSNKARLSETAEQDAASLGKEFLQWAKSIPGAKVRDVVNAINSTFDSRYSGKDIVKAFADKGITISSKNANALQALYKKAVELSTPYFEAKPQRGVGVNEIAAVVLPDTASAELVSKLREAGINILTYKKNNSGDRVSKVNSVENVKFSLRDTTAQKNTDLSDGEEYGLKNLHITEDMSDGERTNILSKKSVVAPIYEGQSDEAIENNSAKLNSAKIGLVKDAIVAISEQFGVLERDISIEDVGVEIRLSKSNLKESVSKKISPSIIAKLIPVLTESVSNAIGVERHSNRYFYDSNTVYFENLLGGYVDGDCFIPVRFGLKHSTTGKATLYVVVDQNKILLESLDKIKTTEVVNVAGSQKAPQNTSRSVEYKISQIIPFVKSKDLLRYIPDNMLNEEQKTAKWEGIAEVIKKTADKNDKKYTGYIKSGNLRAASEMVGRAAKAAGYNIKAYHGTSAGGFTWFDTYAYFSRFGLFGNGAYFTENRDIAEQYTKKGRGNNPQVYSVFLGVTNPIDMDAKADTDAWNKAFQKSGEDFSLLEGEMTNEEAFRSMVEDLEDFEVYSYDAAEIVRNVFESMGYDGITHVGGGRVNRSDGVRHRVWIAFNPEQAKSADTITYDDEGNIIPISERFNSDKYDIRYSLRNQNDVSLQTMTNVRKAVSEKDFTALAKYAEKGVISTEYYNQLVEQYGAIPKGENPHRDVSVPQKTEKNKKHRLCFVDAF